MGDEHADLRALARSAKEIDTITDGGVRNFGTYVDLTQRLRYAKNLLRLMSAQLAFSNVVFVVYAWAGLGWKIPATVISGYLAAMVIELVGLVYVVTRYLFASQTTETT